MFATYFDTVLKSNLYYSIGSDFMYYSIQFTIDSTSRMIFVTNNLCRLANPPNVPFSMLVLLLKSISLNRDKDVQRINNNVKANTTNSNKSRNNEFDMT